MRRHFTALEKLVATLPDTRWKFYFRHFGVLVGRRANAQTVRDTVDFGNQMAALLKQDDLRKENRSWRVYPMVFDGLSPLDECYYDGSREAKRLLEACGEMEAASWIDEGL